MTVEAETRCEHWIAQIGLSAVLDAIGRDEMQRQEEAIRRAQARRAKSQEARAILARRELFRWLRTEKSIRVEIAEARAAVVQSDQDELIVGLAACTRQESDRACFDPETWRVPADMRDRRMQFLAVDDIADILAAQESGVRAAGSERGRARNEEPRKESRFKAVLNALRPRPSKPKKNAEAAAADKPE